MSSTSIPVTDGTWKALNQRKERGQTFDDVIQELLTVCEGADEA